MRGHCLKAVIGSASPRMHHAALAHVHSVVLRELLHPTRDVTVLISENVTQISTQNITSTNLVLADLCGAVALGVQVHAVHRVLDQFAHDPLQEKHKRGMSHNVCVVV